MSVTTFDLMKLCVPTLVTMAVSVSPDYSTSDPNHDPCHFFDAVMAELTRRRLTKDNPDVVAVHESLKNVGVVQDPTKPIPQVIDPEKLDEDTLEKLHMLLFEDGNTPEEYICSELLHVDRNGNSLNS